MTNGIAGFAKDTKEIIGTCLIFGMKKTATLTFPIIWEKNNGEKVYNGSNGAGDAL